MTDLDPILPASTALLLLDFQPAVLSRVEGSAAAVRNVGTVLSAAREANIHIAYVRVFLTEVDAAQVPPTNKMFGHFARMRPSPADGPDSRVAPELGALDTESVYRKTRIGAFSTTDLDRQLRSRRVDTVMIAGVATSGTVLSTVRDAADKDYRTVVLADCCADFDAEVHRVLTDKVFPMTSEVATASAAVAQFDSR